VITPELGVCTIVFSLASAFLLFRTIAGMRTQAALIRRVLTSIPVANTGYDLIIDVGTDNKYIHFPGAAGKFFRNLESVRTLVSRRISNETLILTCLSSTALALAVSIVVSAPLPVMILAAFGLGIFPIGMLWIAAVIKRSKFIKQLPLAIDLMVSTLASGHGIQFAIQTVAEEMPSPVSSEFRDILQRLNLGQPLPDALAYSVIKYKSSELELIRNAIEIQMEVGGSLGHLLDKASETLRERLKLRELIDSLTASGKLSAYIVFFLPPTMFAIANKVNPAYMQPLLDTDLGRTFLCVALVLQLIGMAVMLRMCSFKI
jgi:Flp pilus assembly protein TadB